MVAVTDFNWMFRFCATAAMPAVRQLADQHEFDRRRAFVLGGKDFRMIRIELEGGLAMLLLAEAVKAFDARVTMCAVLPFARRAPLELGGRRSLSESIARVEQSLNVDAVVDSCAVSHDVPRC
jgi:hypothetical protein